MATSGSFDFNIITNEIIESAYRCFNAIPENQPLSNAQYATGKRFLNMMAKAMRAKYNFIWQIDSISVPLSPSSIVLGSDGVDYECIRSHTSSTANQPITGSTYSSHWKKLSSTAGSAWVSGSSYTSICNPSIDSNIVDLEDGFIRTVSSETNTSLNKITRSEYNNRFDSNSTAVPTQFYFERHITPQLFIHPYPDSATNYILEFQAHRFPEDFDAGSDNPDFPPQVHEALVWNLALRLASQKGVSGNEYNNIEKMAERTLDMAFSMDHETGSIFFGPQVYG